MAKSIVKRSKVAIKSTHERLRLSVFRSNMHIFVQIIDDQKGVTLASASSLKITGMTKLNAAKSVGEELARRAKALNIEKVVFDRGRYIYSGRLKALADSAREHGLSF